MPKNRSSECDIESLHKIGPGFARLRAMGIASARDSLSKTPYGVFAELRHRLDPILCRCDLACLVGAGRNVPGHTLWPETTREYPKRFPPARQDTC